MSKFNVEVLKRVILEQRKNFLDTQKAIKREILEHRDFSRWLRLKEIIIITGVRRSGKSFLLRLLWKKILTETKISPENFLYLNFEDEKLINFTATDFDLLIETYYELFSVDQRYKIYLFFDEIQIIAHWEKFLNRLQETGKFKIFVTGSNATLLSKEISTVLTGRNFPLNLFPLSFAEFVEYKIDDQISQKDFYLTEQRAKLKKLFKEYLLNGGFPEVTLQNYRPLLQEYLKNIIYRDIVLRRRIRSEINLREIVSFVVSNIGVPLSLDNIARMTRVKNLMTIKNYLGYLEDSFLFFNVAKHSYSIKKQIYNPDKIYTIDPGLYNEVAILNSDNEGRLLENIVYLHLRRQNKKVFYFQEKNECDFVVQEKNKITEAVQVTAVLRPENREREINGLLEAMKKYNLKKGLIITLDNTDEIFLPHDKIHILPIWQWLLT